jgi:hypothetical protein
LESSGQGHGVDGSAHRDLRRIFFWLTLVALGLWALGPVAYLLEQAVAHRERFSGADSLFAGDQLQYLSWIRSSGEHGLAADDFALRIGGHVYLQPMFLMSGLLWRAGFGIALSYLIWLPAAVGLLFMGFYRYIRRTLERPGARIAALLLALFFVTPADPLVGWTVGSPGLGTFSGELSPTGWLWGYLPTAIAVGLMPLYMLALEQIVEPRLRRPGRSAGWYIGCAAASGLVAAWLHPWQGEVLLAVTAALLVTLRVERSHRWLVIPALATASPLVYYYVLSKSDAAWRLGQTQTSISRPNPLLLLLALAPLLAFAWSGLRLRHASTQDRLLLIWPVASIAVYFVSTGFSPHALEGLSLPLAVLSVRGWRRLRAPGWLAVAAVAVTTVPGLVYTAQLFHDAARSNQQGMLLRPDESRALAFLGRAHTRGGVVSSLSVATAIPAYTGRRSWAGHPSWTPDYGARVHALDGFFGGKWPGAQSQSFLRTVGARWLLSDCEPAFSAQPLRQLIVAQYHFGCVGVYELNVPGSTSTL